MAKLLYVEPDDEVTDLIDRIRRSTADRELVFVVPAGARVLHAPLNLQLLQQYARGFQKTAAIVSEDPRTQGLSIRAGFPTFTSLASWEGGSPVTEPPTAGASASGSGASGLQRAAVGGAAVAAGGAAAAVAERPVRSLTPRPSGRAVPPPTPRSGGRGAALRPWGIGAGALVFLMGLLALLFVVPSATLTVVVRAQQLSDQVTLQGTTISSQASQLDFVQTKALQTAPASGSVRVVPTGIKNIPAVKATGMEALAWDQTYQGTVCLDPNPKGGFATQGGTAFGFPGVSHQSPCHSTPGSLAVVLPACVPGAGSPPATCSPGSYGPYSTPFPIAAVTAGTTGNVGAGTITNWTSDPCAVPNPPSKCTLFGHTLTGQDFSATNPQATSGGVAAKSETIFTSQNQATATQQIDQVV
ncbi:MAG TPA: hypothetical protein VMW49_05390, partial [Candidatus Dormibacteraeota bacterium]|nr:hypothetical protein [Candidatus Dormibacteraeota bacterium]